MPDSGQRFYDESDANEILKIAAREAGSADLVDRSKLVEMAAELGISPDAVARAEAKLQQQRVQDAAAQEEQSLRQEFAQQDRREVASTVASFLGVNGMCVAIWYLTGAGYFWPVWPILGMGIAVVSEVFSKLFGLSDRERRFQRFVRKRQRRSSDVLALGRPDEMLSSRLSLHPMTKREATEFLQRELSLTLADAAIAVDSYASRHPDGFEPS